MSRRATLSCVRCGHRWRARFARGWWPKCPGCGRSEPAEEFIAQAARTRHHGPKPGSKLASAASLGPSVRENGSRQPFEPAQVASAGSSVAENGERGVSERVARHNADSGPPEARGEVGAEGWGDTTPTTPHPPTRGIELCLWVSHSPELRQLIDAAAAVADCSQHGRTWPLAENLRELRAAVVTWRAVLTD